VLTYIHFASKRKQSDERVLGEYIRWHGSIVVNVMGSGKKTYKPTDLFKFSDEETNNKKLDAKSEQAKMVFEKMQKLVNKKYGNDR